MIIVRDRNTRGRTQLGWLDSRHTLLQLRTIPDARAAIADEQKNVLDREYRAELLLFGLA